MIAADTPGMPVANAHSKVRFSGHLPQTGMNLARVGIV